MFAQRPEVAAFEEQFAGYCKIRHAIAANNGTASLHAALASAGIGAGHEVIVPSFSFIATATCVSMCGARPVFADVDPDYFTLDPESAHELFTRSTKAVIGVHLFGQPFDVDPIRELCSDHGAILIEDAAHAHGSVYKEKKVGGLTREQLMQDLKAKRIGTAVHYPIPTHHQPVYQSADAACPVAQELASQVMSLPVHPQVTDENLEYICDTINGMM
jgi:dTDP-4-amino-4,6-dideoxygalactose transaminase